MKFARQYSPGDAKIMPSTNNDEGQLEDLGRGQVNGPRFRGGRA